MATYTVSIVYSSSPRTNYIITSQGTYGNVSKTLQLKIIGASISKYAYWSQTEINPQLGDIVVDIRHVDHRSCTNQRTV